MIKGKHYELTYAPVVRWVSVRLMLVLSIVNKWHTTQIDYVLAYPQAPIEEIYIWKYQGVWSWIDDNGVQSKFRIPNS